MLMKKSEKTSLLDLTIRELRNVQWNSLEWNEFADDFNNPKFIARMRYADVRRLFSWIEDGTITSFMNEKTLTTLAKIKNKHSRGSWKFDNDIFRENRIQFSLEFLTTHAKHLHLNYATNQESITPEFVYDNRENLNYDHFFNNFTPLKNPEVFIKFYNFRNGVFRRAIDQSHQKRHMTAATLMALDIEVPPEYSTVITEQRIMSGNPCQDGQRSFTIWLRKYRRVYNDSNGYPTWDQMLNLLQSHPRLNHHGYVDWIHSRCLFNSDSEVAEYPERLEYQPERVSKNEYDSITGSVDSTDYNTEFADVVAHQVAVERAAERADAVQPQA